MMSRCTSCLPGRRSAPRWRRKLARPMFPTSNCMRTGGPSPTPGRPPILSTLTLSSRCSSSRRGSTTPTKSPSMATTTRKWNASPAKKRGSCRRKCKVKDNLAKCAAGAAQPGNWCLRQPPTTIATSAGH
jgi:hypothetical protein